MLPSYEPGQSRRHLDTVANGRRSQRPLPTGVICAASRKVITSRLRSLDNLPYDVIIRAAGRAGGAGWRDGQRDGLVEARAAGRPAATPARARLGPCH